MVQRRFPSPEVRRAPPGVRQAADTGEVLGLQVYSGKYPGNSGRGDESVVRASGRLASAGAQRRGNSTEGARGGSVERQRVEVRFRLLQMGLSGRALLVGMGNVRTHGQFSQGNRRDEALRRQVVRVANSTQQDHRRGIQNAPVGRAHRLPCQIASRSAANRTGSTAGSRRRRSTSSAAVTAGRGSGAIWATGDPSRVTTRVSPRATRARTSALWLRRSRTVTVLMDRAYHR